MIVFSTGLGAPQGFPSVPVVKVTANRATWDRVRCHIDCFIGEVLDGTRTLEESAGEVVKLILEVANGRPTKAEDLGYYEPTDIWVLGPTI